MPSTESKKLAQYYKLRAEEEGVAFFDASTVAQPDPADGVHLDATTTRAIGDGAGAAGQGAAWPVSTPVTTRPALKSDASEIALLVNIAVHGGIARGWAADERAEGTYDPIEVGPARHAARGHGIRLAQRDGGGGRW